jgi:hypothetical protein
LLIDDADMDAARRDDLDAARRDERVDKFFPLLICLLTAALAIDCRERLFEVSTVAFFIAFLRFNALIFFGSLLQRGRGRLIDKA